MKPRLTFKIADDELAVAAGSYVAANGIRCLSIDCRIDLSVVDVVSKWLFDRQSHGAQLSSRNLSFYPRDGWTTDVGQLQCERRTRRRLRSDCRGNRCSAQQEDSQGGNE